MGKTKLKFNNINHQKTRLLWLRAHPTHYLGFTSLTLLSLITLALIFPFVSSNSSALSSNPPAWIPSNYVTLSLDTMPAIDLVPREGGDVGVSQARLNVSTTSNTGYKLYINTLDDTNAMVSTSSDQPATIQPLASPTALNNFKPNTWGYAITNTLDGSSNATYSPMPTTTTVAYDTTAISGEHYLSFAASIDTSLPAGQYSNTVAISAIANPAVITGMMELSYMQDMTSSICKDTIGWDQNYNRDANGSYTITPGNEVSKQLIDIRDGKEYWVSKLADGNCWMTQNLALDLSTSKTLTSEDTDLNSRASWTTSVDTANYPPAANAAPSMDIPGSWNFGQYVLVMPNRGVSCSSAPNTTSVKTDAYWSLSSGQTLSQNCDNVMDVGASGWQPTFDAATNGIGKTWSGKNGICDTYGASPTNCRFENYTYNSPNDIITIEKGATASEATVAAVTTGNAYDAHYLIGNYYQSTAATAGTLVGLVSTDAQQDVSKLKEAPDSICPKGWKLPAGGNNTITGQPFDRSYSYYRLIYAYGYPATGNYISEGYGGYTPILHGIAGNSSSGIIAQQNPVLHPLYLVATGAISPIHGALRALGHSSNIQLSTAYPNSGNTFAFNLNAAVARIYPSTASGRYDGYSIRCLAR